MNKKGISAVVANVLIVLLVVTSVAIIWAVVRPTIEQAGEGIGAGEFFIGLEIENVELSPGENVKVTVKRRAGKGDVTDLKFIIFDGTKSESFSTNEELNELETKTYTLNYAGLIKKISIAPVFKSASGKEKLGNVADKIEYSNSEVMKNHGAVAWWRFEGNTKDSVGRHDGTLHGDVHCNVPGKYGKGCYFDGLDVWPDDAIEIVGSMNSPDFAVGEGGFTYSAWINADNFDNEHTMIMGSYYPWFSVRKEAGNKLQFAFLLSSGSPTADVNGNTALNTQQWYHVVALFDKDKDTKLYLDGVEDASVQQNLFAAPMNTEASHYIGNWYTDLSINIFAGTIDEPMFFNRGLTEEEVKSLYNLDLS